MNKAELLKLFREKSAFFFHESICPSCHRIPHAETWISLGDLPDDEMEIFFSAQRVGEFERWEPIFIGTHDEPLFDERLNWEGKADKMSQNYIMCVQDYEYDILSNAFLVHKPGIKKLKDAKRPQLEAINQKIIRKEILPEIDEIYGRNINCKI